MVDDRGQPHCDDGPSHRWRDGFEIYHLHGVRFDRDLYWSVVRGMPMDEILRIEDVDQRTQAMRFADVGEFVAHAGAVRLDERVKVAADGTQVWYRIYRFPAGDIFDEPAYYCHMLCPSVEHEHFEGVEPCGTVAEAMAWAAQITPGAWEQQIPLVHEA